MFNHGARGRRSGDGAGITGLATSYIEARSPTVTISGYQVSGSDDKGLDTAGGQTIIITGGGFASGITGTLGGVAIGAITYVSPTQVTFTSPVKSGGLYVLVLTNTNGNTGALVPGLVYSSVPSFTTAAGTVGTVYETAPYSKTIAATSDSTITYALTSGSFPPDATFNPSTGILSGTVPAIASGSTTYNFTITATDSELQDVTRSFSITESTDVLSWVTPSNGATIYLDGTAYTQSLSATAGSGSSITYTANALPTGLTLSSGTISGTPSAEGTSATTLTATATTTTRTLTNNITWVVSLSDVFWKNNALLLTANASAQTSSFVADNSTNNAQITVYGDTKAQNFHPYQHGYYSVYFSANGNYLTGSNSLFNISSTSISWTFECWVFPVASGNYFFGIGSGNSYGNSLALTYGGQTANKFSFLQGNDSSNPVNVTSTNTYPAGVWYHYALTRTNAGVFVQYINGVADGTVTYNAATVSNGTTFIINGLYDNNGLGNNGGNYQVSNLRFTLGHPLYTSNFTPSTTPLLPIQNTVLLACQSNKFADSSYNNNAITIGSTPKLSSANPFTNLYQLSTLNYSTNFNGSSDYLTFTPGTFGSSDFTIEFWYYSTVTTGQVFFNNFRWYNGLTPGSISIYHDGTTGFYFNCYTGAGSAYSGAPGATITRSMPSANAWHHVAAVRQGANIYLGIDGVVTSATLTSNTALNLESRTSYWIGGWGDNQGGPGFWMAGNISNFRIVKGQALYTGNFTPSTSPLTKTTIGTSGTNVAASLTGTVNFLALQSNSIVDSSDDARAITLNTTTVKPQTNSPFLPAYYSNYFNGTADYLTAPSNAAFAMGSNNFTIECWFNTTSVAGTQVLIDQWNFGSTRFLLRLNTTSLQGYFYTTTSQTISGGTVAAGVWNHAALVRNGSTFTLYLNGVSVGTPITDTNPIASGTSTVGIGAYGGNYFAGYISNARIVNGTAVYTSAFTPSTSTLTAITNTVLLTCQSPGFIDNGANWFTLTVNGSPKIAAAAPFVQPTVYSGTLVPSTYGSAYFDGTGDYISAAANSNYAFGATNDFTAECWAYFTTIQASQSPGLISVANSGTSNGWEIYYDSNNGWGVRSNVANVFSNANPPKPNQWYHVAYVRKSGVHYLYVNGVLNVASSSTAYTWSDQVFYSGYTPIGQNVFGYVTDVRLVNGTALYSANFVPQYTGSLTAVANTKLLTLQTNGSHNNITFTDTSRFNNLVTRNGNVTNGTFSPFGDTFSVYFNGSTDYITTPTAFNTVFPGLAGRKIQIEMWVYPTNTSTRSYASGLFGTYGAVAANGRWYFGIDTNDTLVFVYTISTGSQNNINATATAPPNQWSHIAVTVDAITSTSATISFYLNGTASTVSTGNNMSTQTSSYGAPQISVNSSYVTLYTGYISNIRVIKDTFTITGSFTVPTSPLQSNSNTVFLSNQSNNLIDNSINNFALTVTGSPQIQKFAPFSSVTVPKYYSTYFNSSSSDYLTVPASSALNLSTGDYTIEFWVNGNAFVGSDSTIPICSFSTSSSVDCIVLTAVNLWYFGGAIWTASFAINTWYHIAICRVGTVTTAYVNGVSLGNKSNINVSSQLSGSLSLVIGRGTINATAYTSGYISNFRIVKGTAIYTAAFTPPTSPLTAVANTTVLICQSNAFIDNSTSNLTITAGTTTVKPSVVSPFTPTASSPTSYSPTVFGGSMYFDGSGDYLTVGSNSSPTIFNTTTTNWTMQCWYYWPTSASASNPVLAVARNSSGTAKFGIYWASNNYIYVTDITTHNAIAANVTMPLGQWVHLAIVNISSTIKVYINGIMSASSANNLDSTDITSWEIGAHLANSWYSTIYFTDIMLTRTALYTSNFYPSPTPATPTTTIGTTTYSSSLLLKGTSGAIVDQTRTVELETVADTKMTNFSPYNGAYYSTNLTTSSSYLTLAQPALGTSFTFEMWVLPTTTPTYQYLYVGGSSTGPLFGYNNGILSFAHQGGWTVASSTSPTIGVWSHVAVVREGTGTNQTKIYLNGTLVGTGTESTTFGAQSDATIGISGSAFVGYISNFRLTNNQALYTGSFTPSTAPLTNSTVGSTGAGAAATLTGTVLLLTCQSNRFIDKSASPITLTPSGAALIATQNPFQGNTGLSYSFDGTGDYAIISGTSTPLVFGTGDFTIEFWVYFNTISGGALIIDFRPASTNGLYPTIYVPNGTTTLVYLTNSANQIISANGSISAGQWYHVGVVRSSSVTKMYLNGTQVGSNYTDTNAYVGAANRPVLGASGYDLTGNLNGYVTDLRITKGAARTIAVPTLPYKTN